jgi:hypothetical protein
MERDLTELASICLKHAQTAQEPKVTAALLRMAKDYQRRATRLRGEGTSRMPPKRQAA